MMSETATADKGILLIALGHPEYGNMAAHLAATIRLNSSIPIHLVHDIAAIRHLEQKHLDLFSSKAICPDEYRLKDWKDTPILVKLFAPDLSPFDKTLYLDVDMAWVHGKTPEDLIARFGDAEFTIQCRGAFDLDAGQIPPKSNSWCDVNEAKAAYNLTGKWYQSSSDLTYFVKTESVRAMFAKAREVFMNPLCKTTEFNGDVADEFALSVAMNLCGIKPIHDHAVYAAWFAIERPTEQKLRDKYYAYAIGGNRIDDISKAKYINLVRAAFQRLGLGGLFHVANKKRWNPKRSKL